MCHDARKIDSSDPHCGSCGGWQPEPTLGSGGSQSPPLANRMLPVSHTEADAVPDLIERQHLHIAELVLALSERDGPSQAGDADVVLEHTTRYVNWHFATEEGAMEAAGYPGLAAHREEHRMCSERLACYGEELRRNGGLDLRLVARYLDDWLEHHSKHSDAKFLAYIRDCAA